MSSHHHHGFHPFKGRVSRHFGDSLSPSPEDAYLSYYDVRLTREDVDCMKDDWLTDNAIAFWQEYLEHDTLPSYPNSHIILLRPSMSFMLIQTPDPTTLREALPNFNNITHIFLPINDCSSPTLAEGGSHWTLLLVSLIDGVSFHYDSLSPSNRSSAYTASQKLSQLLGMPAENPLKFVDLGEKGCPQQENGSDCGVYVCLIMRFLLQERLLRVDREKRVGMDLGGLNVDAGKGRREMVKLVEGFRREGRRNSSAAGGGAGATGVGAVDSAGGHGAAAGGSSSEGRLSIGSAANASGAISRSRSPFGRIAASLGADRGSRSGSVPRVGD